MDANEVLAFLRRASDDQIRDAVHAFGTDEVMDLVFSGMAERFGLRPERDPGLLVFELDDDGTAHRYGVSVSPGGARHERDPQESARATVRTTVVRFLQVAVGSKDPKKLVLTRKLKLSGDVIWAVTTLASLKK